MDNTSSTAVASTVSIGSVDIAGMPEMRLNTPVVLDAGSLVDAFALCRMCLLRMPLGTLERLALDYALVADETGLGRRVTYKELGMALGRCEHSVKAAVATLRKAGLVMTARTGYSTSAVSFTASPFVSWAAGAIRRSAAKPAVSEPAVSVNGSGEAVHESGFSVSKKPERASKPRLPRAQALAAKKETQTPAPASPDEGRPAILGMAAPYEGEFDNSEELADTLLVTGGSRGGGDDTDDISFGSETDDTDIGQGIRINPNL